ncbi:MAG: hypothetical protein NVS9B7_29300 [Flavisolibacter sp.]
MKTEIIKLLSEYLEQNPTIRFGQALTNLGINEFYDKAIPDYYDYSLRDIYNDSDERILNRIKEKMK